MDDLDSLIKKHVTGSIEEEVVPMDALQKAKGLMRGGASCPYCGKAITPFKKPARVQKLWNVLWLASGCAMFGLSFVIPKYFVQFLVLTLIFAFKWLVEQRSTKTQILIYKALREDESTSRLNDLHEHSTRL